MATHAHSTPPMAAQPRTRQRRHVTRLQPPTDEGLRNTAHLALAAYQPDEDDAQTRKWLQFIVDAATAWRDRLDAATAARQSGEG